MIEFVIRDKDTELPIGINPSNPVNLCDSF
jgi:hypothetical protein